MAHLALDKSQRTYDADGRMHIRCPISKATVNPYRGAEIPDYDKLGLDPNKIYRLLRDPEELAKAAATFNGIPLLDLHIPISSDEHPHDSVVGALGTEAVFEAPYLWNEIIVWTAEALAGIESDNKKELSSAYRYIADMTPGVYQGLTYDGVMRNIVANHVALVEAGRAGSDVVIGDSQMIKIKSRKALMVKGALSVALKPMLAQDAKIDLAPMLQSITAANYKTKKAGLIDAITKATAGKLAQDADIADIVELVDALGDVTDMGPDLIPDDDEPPAVDAEDDPMAKVMAFLKGKISDEDMAQLTQLCGAGASDEPPPFEDKPADPGSKEPNMVSKPAMDAAIKAASTKAASDAVKRVQEIHAAEKVVRPYVGDVVTVAMDSAADVYKFALDALKVDVEGVDPSAYRAILAAQPVPGSGQTTIAQDAELSAETAKAFAGANRIKIA